MNLQYLKYRQIVGLLKLYSKYVSATEFMSIMASKIETDKPYDMSDTINKIADLAIEEINSRIVKVFDNHTFYIEGDQGYTRQFGMIAITDNEWFKELDNFA